MFNKMTRKTYWLIGLLFIMLVVTLLKGCDWFRSSRSPTMPGQPELRKVTLKINLDLDPHAKAKGPITIDFLNENGTPVVPKVDQIVISDPASLVQPVEVRLYVPPCRYLVVVTIPMTEEAARLFTGILDMCGTASLELTVDTYETPDVKAGGIDVLQDSVELGETIRETAEREIEEEGGIEINVGEVFHVADLVVPDDDGRVKFHYVITYILADYVSGEVRPGSDALAIKWATSDELNSLDMSPVVRENMLKAFQARDL